ncbi:hypothetical protein B0O99DRAFT_477498, partial [Bisporella sp. PMI_857]
IVMSPTLFQRYSTDYTNQIWIKYGTDDLVINIQYTMGNTCGQASSGRSIIASCDINKTVIGSFGKPSVREIFAADTGAFAAQPVNTERLKNISAWLNAAINCSTLL